MDIQTTPLAGVLLLTPKAYKDPRGWFLESYHQDRYRAAGISASFVQDNHSSSSQGTLRGLHAQLKRPQAKLVRCVEGSVWDVAVDVRKGSPTFGKWYGAELSGENFRQLYIPTGFLHGFCVLSPQAQVEYKCSDFYDGPDQFGVRWDDPDLGIAWPVKDPLLSEKDAKAPLLKEVSGRFPRA